MFRTHSVPRLGLAIVLMLLIALGPAPATSMAQSVNDDVGNDMAARACEGIGWQDLLRDDGTDFSSERACVQYTHLGGELERQNAILNVTIDASDEGGCWLTMSATGLDPSTSNVYELWVIVRNMIYYRAPIATDADGNARLDEFPFDRHVRFDVVIVRIVTDMPETNYVLDECP